MRIHLRLLYAGILAAAVSLAGAGCQQEPDSGVEAARETTAADTDRAANVLSESDKNFVNKAEENHIKERNIARVALQKSTNGDVKNYAQMLIDDHTEALNELVELMKEKGLPQPGTLPEAKHEALDKLEGSSGAAFDREFINLMVENHQKGLSTYQEQQRMAQDQDVKEYAGDLVPVLQKHLEQAQELQRNLPAGTNTRR